jgi:hypothetical protein
MTKTANAPYPPESKFWNNGYVDHATGLPAFMCVCTECGSYAYCESVDVGVGLYLDDNYVCQCGWESGADGRMNVGSYYDYFV